MQNFILTGILMTLVIGSGAALGYGAINGLDGMHVGMHQGMHDGQYENYENVEDCDYDHEDCEEHNENECLGEHECYEEHQHRGHGC